jgi:hypothetical protein
MAEEEVLRSYLQKHNKRRILDRDVNSSQGATPTELVLEACRRNNTDLLHEVLSSLHSKHSSKTAPKEIASLLNNARDGIGNGVLHIAAQHGHYEVLDILLDQEGLEIEPLDRLEKDTPLHKAVRYVNSLEGKEQWSEALPVVEILLDAGADPRVRNKAGLKPGELADPRNEGLRNLLRKAEYAMQVGDDVVQDEEDDDGDSASDDE